MKKIELTHNQVSFVDDEDYDRLSLYEWRAHRRGGGVNKFYAEGRRQQDPKHLHRFILNLTDNSLTIDHIDGDPLNNQKNNLRICRQDQNNLNRKPYSNAAIQGIKGINFIKRLNKWRAQIQYNKRKIYIGVYEKHTDAAIAYNNMALKLHGEFAYLNK